MCLLKFHPFLDCNQILCEAKFVRLCYLSNVIGVKMHCVASCCKYLGVEGDIATSNYIFKLNTLNSSLMGIYLVLEFCSWN